jgi:uncharacterized integral membrane protein
MSSPKLFAALFLATAVVVFGAQNTQAVKFHFLVFALPAVAVVLPLFAAILLGALLSWIVVVPDRLRGMRRRRSLESQVADNKQAEAKRIETNEQPLSGPTTGAV